MNPIDQKIQDAKGDGNIPIIEIYHESHSNIRVKDDSILKIFKTTPGINSRTLKGLLNDDVIVLMKCGKF